MRRLTIASCVALLLMAAFAPRAATQKPLDEKEWKFTPAKEDPKDDAMQKLLKERYNAAVTEVDLRDKKVRDGTQLPDATIEAAQRAVEAGLELYDKPADQLALLEKHVALAKEHENLVRERVDAGIRTFTEADVYTMKYARVTAEIRLLRFKEKLKGEKK